MKWPLLALAILSPSIALAAVPEDKVGAPYLRVDSGAPDADRVPLKETKTSVQIAGVIARVHLTQVYRNEGRRPLEAIYVFPGSTRAAVFGMKLTVGDRVTIAKIQERDAARQVYEQAKAQGKSASLLEQERPNVFTMNVANILPGDDVKVELDYVEALVPEDNVYELVIPQVVGPRYTGQGSAEAWAQNPYLGEGVASPTGWGLSVKLEAGMGIAQLSSPSHRISPRFSGKGAAALEVDEAAGGNKDFVLRYKLAGDRIETGVLLFPGATPKDPGYFLAMMQPPARLEPAMVPPREYIFILDVSGSMHGYPLDTAKTVMRELLAGLGARDRFNVMFFSGGNWLLSEDSMPATPANVDRAIAAIGRENGGGGTEILPAMRRALSMKRASGMSTTMVVVTDGYVTVEKETFDVIRENLGTANLFAFGIGSSVNRFIIEGMARAGMGEPYVVLGPEQAPSAAAKLKKQIESPVLTDVTMGFEGFGAYDVEPPALPDLFATKPIVVFGKYRGEPVGRITVNGKNGQGELSQSIDVGLDRASDDNVALRYLWARHRIARLSDFGQLSGSDVKAEVTKLGLEHNLLTQYTSFVAVDPIARNTDGKPQKVVQPLPLPKGVEEGAVSQGLLGSVGTVGHGYGGLGASGAGMGGGGYGQSVGRAGVSKRGAVATLVPAPAAPPPVSESKERAKQERAADGDASKAGEALAWQARITGPDRARKGLLREQAAILALWRSTGAPVVGTAVVHSLRVAFEIGADGSVTGARVVRAKGVSDAFTRKLLERLAKLRLDPGAKETVELEIILSSP